MQTFSSPQFPPLSTDTPGAGFDAGPSPLVQSAIHALDAATEAQLDRRLLLREERNIRQPDSWLVERCWQTLADGGFGQAALEITDLIQSRGPQVMSQVLYQLAQQGNAHAELADLVGLRLSWLHSGLLSPWIGEAQAQADRLLRAAAIASRIGDLTRALTYLERLDQLPDIWPYIFSLPELRAFLAESVGYVGLHPLTASLIRRALPRFGETGAQFLQAVGQVAATRAAQSADSGARRLLRRCVEMVQTTTLVDLNCRRYTTGVLARQGLIQEVLAQIDTIADIQDAQRQSGIRRRDHDDRLLRHVVRSRANSDVDFQVYTLQDAIRSLPAPTLLSEGRDLLAERLVTLGVRSDGWTATSTAAALISVGALPQAIRVVDQIAPSDPTRSEGVVSLVRGLLAAGDVAGADAQIQKAVTWVQALEERNVERVTLWGLADVFLAYHLPQQAAQLLASRRGLGFLARLRKQWEKRVDEDELRADRIRLQIALQGQVQGDQAPDEAARLLFSKICFWAPQLLDGEALATFLNRTLAALLDSRQWAMTESFLPLLRTALSGVGGGKHAVRVRECVEQFVPLLGAESEVVLPQSAIHNLHTFLTELWAENSQRGIWQTVYSVEGSLPLLLALAGPDGLVAIARHSVSHGSNWGQIMERAVRTAIAEDAKLQG